MTDPHARIDDYLDGSLPAEDATAFERLMTQNEELSAAVSARRQLRNALSRHRPDLREMMAGIQKENPFPVADKKANNKLPATAKFSQKYWLPRMAVAATIALLALAYFNWPDEQKELRQMAINYGQAIDPTNIFPGLPITERNKIIKTKALTEIDDPLIFARTAVYRDTMLEEALLAYRRISDAAMTDSIRLETALLYLKLQRPTPALPIINRVSGDFSGGIYWYRAIAYLQLGDAEAARTQVQRLVDNYGPPYQKGAAQLINELNAILPSN